jgi:hypothetical protein
VVHGGSVRGGKAAVLAALNGARAVADGVVLEARLAAGQESLCSAAMAAGQGSMVVLRRCELRAPLLPWLPGRLPHISVQVEEGARATAADCACGGRVVVLGQGSSLLHFAWPSRPAWRAPSS